MIEDYKGNSNKSKEELKKEVPEKKFDKVVTGNVKIRKKSGMQKLADEFISEDAKNVKSYIFGEVLIPAIKKAMSDIVKDGIDIILYGGARGRSGRSTTADRVSYRSYYDGYNGRTSDYRDTRSVSQRNDYSYNEIILDSRGEAEEVLLRMDEIMEKYGLVRVADLYDLVGITGNFTDNKYGWTNIRSAYVDRVRDGYIIRMPRAVPID